MWARTFTVGYRRSSACIGGSAVIPRSGAGIIAAPIHTKDREAMPITLPTRKSLTLEAARIAMAASEAEAQRNGWKVVISVVDDGGHVIMVHRIDGTQYSSIDTATAKA